MSLMNPLIHQNEKTNTDPDSFKTTYGMNPQRCQYVIKMHLVKENVIK